MSVIAWDRKTLAADRMQCDGPIRSRSTKLHRHEGVVIGTCGSGTHATMLLNWYMGGMVPSDFPEPNENTGKAILVVMSEYGFASEFRGCPTADVLEDEFYAWGEGAAFAIGAMAMGADARRAVEVANELCVSCGFGVDAFDCLYARQLSSSDTVSNMPKRQRYDNLPECRIEGPA
jgi:hypothetical protein